MIISHKHKFIFIKTRKTASTSLEITLSSICGKNDIITPISPEDEKIRKEKGYQGAQNYYIPFKYYSKLDWIKFITKGEKKKFYNHMPANKIKKNIPNKIWANYYKFCFDRNPFDKIVSCYYYYINRSNKNYNNITEFINSGGLNIIKGFDLYSINKILAVDDVFKYEQLNESLKKISEKLNLNKPLKPDSYKAKSHYRENNKHYSELLNEEDKRKIELAFAREIKLHNYFF